MSTWNTDYTEWPKRKETDCVVFKDNHNDLVSFNMTCSTQLSGEELVEYVRSIRKKGGENGKQTHSSL